MAETVDRPRVIVAPTAHQYGLARMFQLVTSEERRLTVVHTMDEALAELDVQFPHFEPLQ